MEGKGTWLAQMHQGVRLKHLSIRTEASYVRWGKRFMLFHHKRHPYDLGAAEIRTFLLSLAVQERVAAST